MNTWDLIKRQLESRLSGDTYQNWVSKTEFSHIQDNKLCVAVPNEQTRDWMDSEYTSVVGSLLRDMGVGLSGVVYELASAAPVGKVSESFLRDDTLEAPRTQLNPKFTFDNFVVGSCNQFAHAAAKSVATTPSRSYNPLFIYSGVGMGKTHLMHAIGRALMDNYSGMRIIYTSSERFMNEMITCIRLDRMARFHAFYRSADVLLVDDIHVLGGKERTQEEFFHTFNELYDHQKQIVISSDSTPKEIPGLVERLRSRFEWGLMVDMQPPDLETKMAILDKKAENGRRPAPRRRPHFHGDQDQVQRARARRRPGEADGLLLADRGPHHDADGPAGPEAPGPRPGPPRHHRFDPESRRRVLRFEAGPAQGKEQYQGDCLPQTGRHVPGERAYFRLFAGDWTGLRRQAPYHGASFRQ